MSRRRWPQCGARPRRSAACSAARGARCDCHGVHARSTRRDGDRRGFARDDRARRAPRVGRGAS